MALIESYDFYNLKNEAENLVLKELSRQLEDFTAPICLCNDCVVDMAAVALNTVKPLYRVSLLGGLYTAAAMDDDKSYAASIREAVTGAIEKVRNNPSHDIANAEDSEETTPQHE
ncbi:MAG: late competence development ComFB family protein [Treponema sp.]|jgi:competence protein ComFB|nr:late competence development ComFB family protein [Treponema sp.]